jgi:hypothetical protein
MFLNTWRNDPEKRQMRVRFCHNTGNASLLSERETVGLLIFNRLKMNWREVGTRLCVRFFILRMALNRKNHLTRLDRVRS